MDEHQPQTHETTPQPPPPPEHQPPPPAAAPGTMSEHEARQWAMLTHLSALIGVVTGIGFLVGPLVMWLLKKDQSPYVDEHGKEAVNFQITMMLAAVVSAILAIVLIGFVLLLAIAVMVIVLPIIAGVKANEGEYYKYPLTIRFLK